MKQQHVEIKWCSGTPIDNFKGDFSCFAEIQEMYDEIVFSSL